jgi:hypothetical protein
VQANARVLEHSATNLAALTERIEAEKQEPREVEAEPVPTSTPAQPSFDAESF